MYILKNIRLCLIRQGLLVLIAFTCCLVSPSWATAMTNDQWVTRVFNDALLRDPTLQEKQSALGALGNGQSRLGVAYAIFTGSEYFQNLIGGRPNVVPGYFQTLVNRSPSNSELNYFNCLRQFVSDQDEQAIAAIITNGQGGSPAQCGNFSNNTFAEYRARALANNPGLALCSSDEALIDQLYQDLLGRHASTDELNLGFINNVANILFFTQPKGVEYGRQIVRSAFLRFLHRPPRTAAGTSPDPNLRNNELDYYEFVLESFYGLQNPPDEVLSAFLVSLPEYGQNVVLPAIIVPQTPVVPANITLELPPPQDSLLQFQLEQTPPLLLNPILIGASQSTRNLLAQVISQQQTIQDLVLADFNKTVTADAASAQLEVAQQKIIEVRTVLQNNCPPSFECNFTVSSVLFVGDPMQLQHADTYLQLGFDALGAGDYMEASNDARHAYSQATKALRKVSK
jgi:hypothetical protein